MNRYTRWDTRRALEVIEARCGVTVTEVPCGTPFLDRTPRPPGPLTEAELHAVRMLEEVMAEQRAQPRLTLEEAAALLGPKAHDR